MEWLKNKYEQKKTELEKSGESVEARGMAAEVLREHIKEETKKRNAAYMLAKTTEESLVAKMLNLPPESHDKKIEELLAVAEEHGVLNAIAIVRKLKDPHLEDDLHRALIQFYIKGDISKQKTKKPLSRALDMVLYEISLPREKEDWQKEKSFKEFVSAMEQFYIGMTLLDGGKEAPRLALEIGLPAVGEEIVFYAAAPRDKGYLLEKQISALFADARVEEKRGDYNIFNPGGVSAGAVLKLKTYSVFPIRTYDKFEIDPLLVIANSFSKLHKTGEGAAFQIILGQSDISFAKKIKKTAEEVRAGQKLSEALKKAKITGSRLLSFFDDLFFRSSSKKNDSEADKKIEKQKIENEDVAKIIDEKAARPLMAVNLRILVSADSEEKSDRILKEIESAFLQFAEPQANAFKFQKLRGRDLDNLFYNFSFRLFDERESVYLNTAELATIFHFPKGISSVSQLKYVKAKDAPPPLNLSRHGILIGKNIYRGDESMIYMSEDDRRRHFYLIGQTGTGKSVLLKNMIVQDIENGKGVCYIDPHGSDLEDILSRIPENRIDDLIYFDPANMERVMGLNMLEYDPEHPEQKTFIANEVYGIFRKIWKDVPEAFGPMFEQYYRNAVLLTMDDTESGNTLMDAARVMSNKQFRDLKLSRCRNPVVKLFWKDVAEKAGGESALQNIVPYITSKFDVFLSDEIMRPIIAQEKSAFNFRKIMDERKILLINLSKGRLGDINSNLIGLIVVGKLLMAALSRVNAAEDQRGDFYLYIDEFQNVTTDSIATILSEARKYRLNLTIAHQFIGQLEEFIKKSIFGNVGSMCAFRVGAEDAEFLSKQFEQVFSAGDLLNIDNYRAYLKLLVEGQVARPFNIATLPFEKGNVTRGMEAAKLSLIRYGVNRAVVEEEIKKKYDMQP